jgi:hypothetical protein
MRQLPPVSRRYEYETGISWWSKTTRGVVVVDVLAMVAMVFAFRFGLLGSALLSEQRIRAFDTFVDDGWRMVVMGSVPLASTT